MVQSLYNADLGPIWEIRLRDPDGTWAGEVTAYDEAVITLEVNARSSFSVRMPADNEVCGLFKLDSLLQFRRCWPRMGIAWNTPLIGLHRVWHWKEQGAKAYFESRGYGALCLLGRRIINAADDTLDADKSGPSESVLKEYVTEQAATGERAILGLSVEADGANGNAWEGGRSYRTVREVVEELAPLAGGDVEMVTTIDPSFTFTWHTGQLGTDRTGSIVFSKERGNMMDPELLIDHTDEINAVLVGGKGEGGFSPRWVEDATAIAASPWNRCEGFVNASNEDTTDAQDARGAAELKDKRPKQKLTFRVQQTEGCLFGKEYFLGDLVKAYYRGMSFTMKVMKATFTLTRNAGEVCEVELLSQ